ncbi:hypothetical protein BJ875DRAFT_203897 [Amylocarpus encephaloides]|uniref:Tat pathway signal sequence protein n=1 Tax=Amylocarpus encephaloides TaxID=45428 RepID=A0A9P8C7J4_9HELO|nr:hypothetical protein BJ875DRAFT_203897 [Amylocarpus encephaloides]
MGDSHHEIVPFIHKAYNISSEHKLTEGESEEKRDRDIAPTTVRKWRRHFLYLIVPALIFSNLFTVVKWREAYSNACIRPQLTYSPTKSITTYERKTLWRDIDNNVFTGSPRPEFDKAWHELLSPMVIRITNDELKTLHKPSLALLDGSGFIAETAAYHELHCIKRLRRHLFVENYYPNMTEAEEDRENRHVDHCLEYLREAAMCRGDPTLVPFHWEEGKPFSSQESVHECINWESFANWAESRKIDASQYSKLSDDVVYPI